MTEKESEKSYLLEIKIEKKIHPFSLKFSLPLLSFISSKPFMH